MTVINVGDRVRRLRAGSRAPSFARFDQNRAPRFLIIPSRFIDGPRPRCASVEREYGSFVRLDEICDGRKLIGHQGVAK